MISMRFATTTLVMLVFCLAGAAPVRADQYHYTTLDLEDREACRMFSADAMGARWSCPGFQGIHVFVAEGDLRMFVSFGGNAMNEPAAEQTFPEFNTVHTTLEWVERDAGGVYATILRWFLDQGDGSQRQVLVVTFVSESLGVCHMAHVDAQQPNANQIARDAAAQLAPNWDCAKEPVRF